MSGPLKRFTRVVAVAGVLCLSTALAQPAALAQNDGPPEVLPAMLPSDGPPAPLSPTQQRNRCQSTQPDTDLTVPPAQRYLDFRPVWRFTRGAGQTIAIIDTGVAPSPLFADRLVPGGDYVSAGNNGTQDCDAHGTLVAGIVGARGNDNGQGFSGVAPDARLITIRALSSAYEAQGTVHQNPGDLSNGYGPLAALAAAIVHAVNLGATVINISLTSCTAAPTVPADGGVGAALQYAAQRRVVVVAAAGNLDENCQAGNPGLLDPAHGGSSPWSHITTYVTPARYSQYLLAVGSIDESTGRPSVFTVPGPWVGVAAPGEQIVSTAPDGQGLTKDKIDDKGDTQTFQGTSFAAPYVAGIAALVRAEHPTWDAQQVIERIKETAHAPGGGWNPYIGYGIVDPLAAVTADLPPAQAQGNGNNVEMGRSEQLSVPTPPPPVDHTARNAALVAAAVIVALLVLGLLGAAPLRRMLDRPKP
jgi:membrane-anchored mycosin MYCP